MQTEFQPEIGLLFHNTKDKARFSSEIESAIDDLIQGSFLEFIQDDLDAVTQGERNTGGLLGQDEKKGFERLIEALQCSMWSNM